MTSGDDAVEDAAAAAADAPPRARRHWPLGRFMLATQDCGVGGTTDSLLKNLVAGRAPAFDPTVRVMARRRIKAVLKRLLCL